MTIHNEHLKRENVFKTDNTQLRSNYDAMKDENKQLRAEVQQLKVSLWL